MYVAHERKTNSDFPKINLWEEEKSILANIEQKWWSLLVEEKAFDSGKVSSEINEFVNNRTSFDEGLKSSLDTKEFEKAKLNLDEQKKLSAKYPELVDKILDKIVAWNEKLNKATLKVDYKAYLNGEKVDKNEIKLFEKI